MRPSITATLAVIAIALLSSCSGTNDPEPVLGGPKLRIAIDSTSAFNGQYLSASVRCLPLTDVASIDSISSFDLVVYFDDSLVSFTNARPGDAISNWEYFTYRHYPTRGYSKSGSLRIIGVRDLSNGNQHPDGQHVPNGELARLDFSATTNREKIGLEQRIGYWFGTCTDNTLTDAAEPNKLHMALTSLPSSGASGYFDTLNCPRLYELAPDIEFVAGAIKILPPPDDRPESPITVSIGSVSGQVGDTVRASVRIDYALEPPYVPPGLGGLQFTIMYDTAAIKAIEVVPGDQLADWEYFSGRVREVTGWPRFQSSIRIVSILEMNNGAPSAGKNRPEGDLAVVRLVLQRDLSVTDACEALTFFSAEPDDNILADVSGSIGYLPFPGQSGIEFALSYDTLDCGPVDSCEMIVAYLKSGCPE